MLFSLLILATAPLSATIRWKAVEQYFINVGLVTNERVNICCLIVLEFALEVGLTHPYVYSAKQRLSAAQATK